MINVETIKIIFLTVSQKEDYFCLSLCLQRLFVLWPPWDGENAGGPGAGQRVQQWQQEGGLLHEEGGRLPQQVGWRVGAPAAAAVRAGNVRQTRQNTPEVPVLPPAGRADHSPLLSAVHTATLNMFQERLNLLSKNYCF